MSQSWRQRKLLIVSVFSYSCLNVFCFSAFELTLVLHSVSFYTFRNARRFNKFFLRSFVTLLLAFYFCQQIAKKN